MAGMIASFLKYIQYEKRFSRHTITSYRTDLKQFEAYLRAQYDGTPAEAADYGLVRSWIVTLSDDGLDATSINRKIASLRAFYRFLLRGEHIQKDPMQRVKVVKVKRKLPHFVKENEMSSVIDSPSFTDDLPGKRDRLILEMLYGTGMRLSELIGLKDTDVDLRGGLLKVLGKRNKERVIPISKPVVTAIEEYRTARNKAVDRSDHGKLLVNDSGGPLYPMMVYRTIRKYLGPASVEKKSPHVLRHTYATHLLNRGAEINAVKDLLGHSSLAATQVYTHNTMEKLKKIFDQAHPKA
jgi:integrase/recombinase XerC